MAMLLVRGVFHHDPNEEILITGGGDGKIKLWSIDNLEVEGLMLLDKFKNEGLSVLSLAYSGTFLYVGFSDGKAHVYSLDSRQLVQKLDVRCGDVGTIEVIGGKAFCGMSGGYVKVSHLLLSLGLMLTLSGSNSTPNSSRELAGVHMRPKSWDQPHSTHVIVTCSSLAATTIL